MSCNQTLPFGSDSECCRFPCPVGGNSPSAAPVPRSRRSYEQDIDAGEACQLEGHGGPNRGPCSASVCFRVWTVGVSTGRRR